MTNFANLLEWNKKVKRFAWKCMATKVKLIWCVFFDFGFYFNATNVLVNKSNCLYNSLYIKKQHIVRAYTGACVFFAMRSNNIQISRIFMVKCLVACGLCPRTTSPFKPVSIVIRTIFSNSSDAMFLQMRCPPI